MQLGTTKEQDLYNKPLAAVHPGALAAGTLPQYNTTVSCSLPPTHLNSSQATRFPIFKLLNYHELFNAQ